MTSVRDVAPNGWEGGAKSTTSSRNRPTPAVEVRRRGGPTLKDGERRQPMEDLFRKAKRVELRRAIDQLNVRLTAAALAFLFGLALCGSCDGRSVRVPLVSSVKALTDALEA